MRAKVFYEEVATYIKSHYKVTPLLKRIDDKTIEATCKLAKLFPTISIQIKVEGVKDDVLCIAYESSTAASLIIEKAIDKVGGKIPNGIEISTQDRRITLYFSQIEKTKKVMEHIKLENIYVNEDSLEVVIGLK